MNRDELFSKASMFLTAFKGDCDFAHYGVNEAQVKEISKTVNSALSTVGLQSTCVIKGTRLVVEGGHLLPTQRLLNALEDIKTSSTVTNIGLLSKQNLSNLKSFTEQLKSGAAGVTVSGKAIITGQTVSIASEHNEAARAA